MKGTRALRSGKTVGARGGGAGSVGTGSFAVDRSGAGGIAVDRSGAGGIGAGNAVAGSVVATCACGRLTSCHPSCENAAEYAAFA